jgi:hypothetical protein
MTGIVKHSLFKATIIFNTVIPYCAARLPAGGGN